MLQILGKIKKNDLAVLKHKHTDFLFKCIKAYNIMTDTFWTNKEDAKATINAFLKDKQAMDKLKNFDIHDCMNGKKGMAVRSIFKGYSLEP